MHPLVVGVICFVAGGAVGYFLRGHLFKKKCKECMQDWQKNFEEMDEYYLGKHPEKNSFIDVMSGDLNIQSIDCEYKKPNKVDYAAMYQSSGGSIDPADYEHPSDDADEIHNKDVGEFLYKQNERDRLKPPKPIKAEEFGELEDRGFITMSLVYYQGNDTLIVEEPEGDTQIYPDELSDWVGDSLTKFGNKSFKYNDDRVLYVRNYSRMIDFEISKSFSSYGEED